MACADFPKPNQIQRLQRFPGSNGMAVIPLLLLGRILVPQRKAGRQGGRYRHHLHRSSKRLNLLQQTYLVPSISFPPNNRILATKEPTASNDGTFPLTARKIRYLSIKVVPRDFSIPLMPSPLRILDYLGHQRCRSQQLHQARRLHHSGAATSLHSNNLHHLVLQVPDLHLQLVSSPYHARAS